MANRLKNGIPPEQAVQVQESIKEINSGSRKSIFLPAPAKVAAKNILLIKEPDAKAASFLVLRYYEEIMSLVKSAKAKDFAYLMSSTTSKDFDLVLFFFH